jgi:multidrug efflux pump subunit AcrA (membrane-fusion protein)
VGQAYEALLVSKDAFSTSGDDHHVFVVRDDQAHSVRVKKGQAFGSLIVTEGVLSDHEMVVVEGNERLRAGQRVRVVEGDGHKAKGQR